MRPPGWSPACCGRERAGAGSHPHGGVCAPLGFRAGVAAAGIRGDGDETRTDVTVIRSDMPAIAAGVFTRNTVKAAPVVISQLTLRRGAPISAIVVNAGNANACTGAQGFRDALVMCTIDRRRARPRPERRARVQHRRHRTADADGPHGARHPRGCARDVTRPAVATRLARS